MVGLRSDHHYTSFTIADVMKRIKDNISSCKFISCDGCECVNLFPFHKSRFVRDNLNIIRVMLLWFLNLFISTNYYFFPFFSWLIASEQTRVLLTSAAFVHLKKGDFTKHTRNLAPASRTILLSGPAGKLYRILLNYVLFMVVCDCTIYSLSELYQQMLAKALAHYFEAKLLLLDITDFSLKVSRRWLNSHCWLGIVVCVFFFWFLNTLFEQMLSKYGSPNRETVSSIALYITSSLFSRTKVFSSWLTNTSILPSYAYSEHITCELLTSLL